MKRKFTCLLPVLLAFACGCNNYTNTAPVPVPAGTFNGTFKRFHRSFNGGPIDSVKANIQVVLDGNGNFKVLGDTTTIHSGSTGQYSVDASSILFLDTTYPKKGTPSKTHLNGLYVYVYDGTTLQIAANSLDTLSLQYNLKK